MSFERKRTKKERQDKLTLKTLKVLSIHSSRDRILLLIVFKYTIIKLICLLKIKSCLDIEDDFTYKIVVFKCFRSLIFAFVLNLSAISICQELFFASL